MLFFCSLKSCVELFEGGEGCPSDTAQEVVPTWGEPGVRISGVAVPAHTAGVSSGNEAEQELQQDGGSQGEQVQPEPSRWGGGEGVDQTLGCAGPREAAHTRRRAVTTVSTRGWGPGSGTVSCY